MSANYDEYMSFLILPEIKKALKKEAQIAKDCFSKASPECKKFHTGFSKGIPLRYLTDSAIQYIILREFRHKHIIIPNSEIFDLSIYLNGRTPQVGIGDIQITIKRGALNCKGELSNDDMDTILETFEKQRKYGIMDNYLLTWEICELKYIDFKKTELQIPTNIDKRDFVNYKLRHVATEYFKPNLCDGYNDFVITLWKIEDNKEAFT